MILTLTLPAEIDAQQITIGDEEYLLIPLAAIAPLYRPRAALLPERAPKRPYHHRAKAGRKTKALPPPSTKRAKSARKKDATDKPVREGSLGEAILDTITSAPGRTPGQIFDWVTKSKKMSTTSGSVYQTIKILEKRGLVEPRENEERGGVVGWYRKDPKA